MATTSPSPNPSHSRDLGFSIAAKPSQPVVIAGEPFDLDLTTTGADGKPSGETLKVAVLRMEKSKTSRILTLLPWPQAASPPSAEVKDSELDAKTDAATGKARVPLKLEKGGIYRFASHRHGSLRPDDHA